MRVAKLGLLLPGSSGAVKRLQGFSTSPLSRGKGMAAASMAEGQTKERLVDADIATLIKYHEETKHSFNKYARGPYGLDWANQPNPFRRYQGAWVVKLEHFPESPAKSGDPLWPVVFAEPLPPKPLDKSSLSQLLYDSLALSAWKVAGRSTWSLRVNPSSGNLHPMEGYCNHDVGHAIGAVVIAAASLGWNACLLDGYGGQELGCLLGLPRVKVSTDRGPAKGVMRELETEHADCIIAVFPSGEKTSEQACYHIAELMGDIWWMGKMNALSKEHVRWGIIYEAAQASEKRGVGNVALTRSMPLPNSMITSAEYEPLTVRQVVRKHRSTVSMDGTYGMLAAVFFQILAKTLPTGGEENQGAPRQLPFGVLPWNAEVHLAIFVHRVVGLTSGIYLLVRNEAHAKELAKAMAEEFVWEKPEKCPSSLPLYALQYGDVKELAMRLSCDQEIAGEGFFSLGMLARFEPAMKDFGPSMYPRLFWETGLIRQVLYLEAHAFGVSATGIGCFLMIPNAVHQVLGLKGSKFLILYHFTVGVPRVDKRIQKLPAYPGPSNSNF